MKNQKQEFSIGEEIVDVEFEFDGGCAGSYHEPPSGVEFNIVSIKKDGVDITDIIDELGKLEELNDLFCEEYLQQCNDAKEDYEINKYLNRD